MNASLITDRAVRSALYAIRYAQPLESNSLVDLDAVTHRLRDEGADDDPAMRAWVLARVLIEIVSDNLSALRPAGTVVTDATTASAQQRQLIADFRSGGPPLAAWSAVHHRYLATNPLQMREMADALDLGERTLLRRLNQGHGLLADKLREIELAASSERPAPTGDGGPDGHAMVALGDLPAVACPYRGLSTFREEDAGHFFGRESFTELLVARVNDSPLVGVVGPSGSGKSSVVFAGLVPELRSEDGAAAQWSILGFRPGGRPYHALAGGLVQLIANKDATDVDRLSEVNKLASHLRSGSVAPRDVLDLAADRDTEIGKFLLIADQFEELFTLCADEGEQQAFQDMLFETAGRHRGKPPVTIGLTLRGDFVGHALSYRPFADAMQGRDVMLGPMNQEEMASAIRLPAEIHGRAFEPGLVERIVEDVGNRVGALPALEFALTRLWEHQSAGWLTHAAYESIGRVQGAVSIHADRVVDALSDLDQDRARRIFVQLVQPGAGTEDTRRVASRDDLSGDWDLVHVLADARLVTTGVDESGHETAELVHEALIRSWGRLREWMNLDRQFRLWQERLRAALHLWLETDRADGALLRGVSLAEAERWFHEREDGLAPAESEFVSTSLEAQSARRAAEEARLAHEKRLERRGRRLLGLLFGGALVAAGIGFALSMAAIAARRESDRQAVEARRSAVVATSRELLARGQGDLALALALEAVADGKASPAAELALSEAAYIGGTRHVLPVGASKLAISPDGRVLLTAGSALSLWDLATGEPLGDLVGHLEYVDSAAFSADGRLAVSSSDDAIGASPDKSLIVWDLESRRPRHSFPGHTNWVMSAALSPDSRRLLSGSSDGTVRLWDVDTPSEVWQLPIDTGLTRSIGFLGDSGLAAVHNGDGPAVIDLDTKEVRQLDAPINDVTGDPHDASDFEIDSSGRRLVGAYYFGGAHIWDPATGTKVGGLSAAVEQIAFLPDPRFVLATNTDQAALAIWNTDQQTQVARYVGHGEPVRDIAVAPDGLTAASVDDSALRIWNLWGSALFGVLSGHSDAVTAVAVSEDGRSVLTGSFDGTARLWDPTTGMALREFSGHADRIWSADLTRDGRTAATGSSDRTAIIWDTTSGARRHVLRHGDAVNSVGFSRDGETLLTASPDGMTRLWDVASGRELRRLSRTGMVKEGPYKLVPRFLGRGLSDRAIFGPGDGQIITAGSSVDRSTDNTVVLRDASGRALSRFTGHTNEIFDMLLSRDARTLITASMDRTIRWWDLRSGEETLQRELDSPLLSMALGPDGRLLLAGTVAGDMFIIDAATSAVLRRYDASMGKEVGGVAFSPDGRAAYSGTGDGRLLTWAVHRTLRDLLDWLPTRRYVVALTCEQRLRFATLRQCGSSGEVAPAEEILEEPPPESSDIDKFGGGAVGPETIGAAPAADISAPGAPTEAPVPAGSVLSHIEVEPGEAGHTYYDLLSVAASPDGARAIVGGAYGVTGVDLATGRVLWRVEEDSQSYVPAVAVSPDGTTAVSGHQATGDLVAWHLATGERVAAASGGGPVYCLAISPDGRRVAFGTMASLGVWDRESAKVELVPEGTDALAAVAFSPDGQFLLTGGADGIPRIWDVPEGGPPTPRGPLGDGQPKHADFVRAVALSPDGRSAVTADAGALLWWDVETGTVTRTDTTYPGTFFTSFSADGRHLLTSSEDAVVRVWDTTTRDVVRELRGHTGVRIPAAFAGGACKVVSAGDDGRRIVWDTKLCATGDS